jgi:hypothetical protein
MTQTAQPIAEHARTQVEPHGRRRGASAFPPGAQLAQLASAINGSPRVQNLSALASQMNQPRPPQTVVQKQSPVVQRVEIVGVKDTEPHPTQDEVNEHIVKHKVEALESERYPVTYAVAPGDRDDEETTFVSDGHHAYVAAQRQDVEIEAEDIGVGASALTWQDVSYSDSVGWYENWLEEESRIDLTRMDNIKNASEGGDLEDAWDALRPWEKAAVFDDVYEDVRDELQENDLLGKLDELQNEVGQEGGEEEGQQEEGNGSSGEDEGNLEGMEGIGEELGAPLQLPLAFRGYFYFANYGIGSQVHGYIENASITLTGNQNHNFHEAVVHSGQCPGQWQSFTFDRPFVSPIGQRVWVQF